MKLITLAVILLLSLELNAREPNWLELQAIEFGCDQEDFEDGKACTILVIDCFDYQTQDDDSLSLDVVGICLEDSL